jgi:hypothetical protein
LSAVAAPATQEVEERRAFRQAIRNVSRLLRGVGTLLVIVGLGGLLTGGKGDWWIAPSWVSLIIGAGLLAAGVVQRVRQRRKRTDGLPEA